MRQTLPLRVLHLLACADRAEIEATIEAAIAYLDAMDGDPEMESDDEDQCPAGDDNLSDWGRTIGLGAHHETEDLEREEDRCAAYDDLLEVGALNLTAAAKRWHEPA